MPHPGDQHSQWIRGFAADPVDAVPRLLCFPHAGGSASAYHPLATRLGRAADVRAVQYPGRQDRLRERPVDSLDALADQVFARLTSWTDRPLVLFGHSMGAVLAYEVARRLEERTATPPLALIVSGRRAPSVVREDTVHLRDDQGVLEEVRRLTGTDPGLLRDEEVVRMIMPSLRADYRAIETYRHQPGTEPRCPVTALVGDADDRAPVEDVRRWADHTRGEFALHVLPGGHFYLNTQWDAVAERVLDRLAAITSGTT
ncbi:thioesterase [Streptomyces sp. AJS327]|uniref:thioesterase II family protein n=1 Tax=Streptomyces sp. AJS327 TaxID=2545265 RepID=UPI0015DF7C89|nr:alpha/beta fold hydrolase [Streptomyces sp. AJS327]MBA0050627.1 thioesterase [Streptomyces sp. AJS327]